MAAEAGRAMAATTRQSAHGFQEDPSLMRGGYSALLAMTASPDIALRAVVAQPQADQQAAALDVVEVVEFGAAVADLTVGDVLDLPSLESELELQRVGL